MVCGDGEGLPGHLYAGHAAAASSAGDPDRQGPRRRLAAAGLGVPDGLSIAPAGSGRAAAGARGQHLPDGPDGGHRHPAGGRRGHLPGRVCLPGLDHLSHRNQYQQSRGGPVHHLRVARAGGLRPYARPGAKPAGRRRDVGAAAAADGHHGLAGGSSAPSRSPSARRATHWEPSDGRRSAGSCCP